MIRLFAGLALPPDLSEELARLQGGIPDARWTAPENLHITLTFIGQVPEDAVEDVDDALASVYAPAFDLNVSGIDSFAQGNDPKVIWLGLGDSKPLHTLKTRIDDALTRYAIPFEKRKYIPHITLARFRHMPDMQKTVDFMQAHENIETEAFPVDEFILYSSTSGKNGPVYEPLEYYPLGG